MHRLVGIVLAGTLLVPGAAMAQMQPHHAEYALRLGVAAGAPRIGTAVEDLSLDCSTGWHLKRDIKTEITLSASWKMTVSSSLDAEEQRSGHGLRFRTVQSQNGSERESKGRVQRQGNELRAEVVQPGSPPNQFVLPPATLMPVAALNHLVERLQAKAAAFPALMFDAEVIGDVFLIDVTEQDAGKLRALPDDDRRVTAPSATSWPVFMTFTRGRQQDQRPLFTVAARVYDNGILDRLTIETGLVTVAADLQSLDLRPIPNCPRA